ncbi:uncharacterized protein EV420DRAFT_1493334 [Desarmillaria tabescens]|uniref:Uncharacterized protein n=1 Tax=Armillaria tabescens TaxID=1929756 RepID=A0AA39NPM3_ARMTA|nr:uncharacterized protein EV420DRAFT_1493334 [Desarmillaria tabescens]KAK0469253.1 hypothetical protein EV420DRAFT_1493334 [Desarmillaria tabescens]
MFYTDRLAGFIVSSAAFVALTDFSRAANRTAQTGTSSYADVFILAPLFSHDSVELPNSQTGLAYIGNTALVRYLQCFGQSGHIVEGRVFPNPIHNTNLSLIYRHINAFLVRGPLPTLLYTLGLAVTFAMVMFLIIAREWWGLGMVAMIFASRLTNIVIARRRIKRYQGGELDRMAYMEILMNRDRWIRLRGMSDDLEAIVSFRRLRDKSTIEGLALSCANLLVLAAAAFAGNISPVGSLTVIGSILSSAALFSLSKSFSRRLQIFGCIVTMDEVATVFERQVERGARDMVERSDLAIGWGLTIHDGV